MKEPQDSNMSVEEDKHKKAILVTGASSGIGHCVALGLKERGYQVVATVRKQIDRERLAKQGLDVVMLDLTSSSSIQACVEQTLEFTDGKLFGLFNNGAYGQPGAVEDLTRDALREQFEVNLFGTQELTNLIIPVMRQQKQGRIIQNSSVLGLVALAHRGAYNATKFALNGLSETLRMELKGSGIFVSLVEPGPIESQFRANATRAFRRHIDVENSVHRNAYKKTMDRLETEGSAVPFTLPPEAVLKKVIHALESSRPKNHYFVTFPTHLFAFLRRILPDRMLQKILSKV
ncbi:MAG: SDR family oxidoreductase [Gammaproteobacteria bacterium]